jgi:hypothetical protein
MFPAVSLLIILLASEGAAIVVRIDVQELQLQSILEKDH